MAAAKKAKPNARAKAAISLPPVEEVARALLDDVRTKGAVPKAAVTKAARSGPRSLEVFDALTSAGLEVGARFVRVPLEAQVEAALRDAREPLALRALASRVRGATPREASDAALALVERGRLRLVARKREVLVGSPTTDLLDGAELERLQTAVAELAVTLATAKKKRATMLAADLEPLLRAVRPRPSSPPRRAEGEVDARSNARGEVAGTVEPDVENEVVRRREASGLTSVPGLVRALGGADAKVRAAIHAELLRGARAGRLELRPESGMGRLTTEELALCIPGPQGTHLSWVRRVEEP